MGNGFVVICTDTTVIELRYPAWVKLHTSAELKPIRIAVPTVLGELRCGHITSVSSGIGWVGVSCFGKVSGSCAMCEESGSNLKLRSCVDQHYVLLGTRKLALKIISFK